MKVMLIKADGSISMAKMFTIRQNEISLEDIRKMIHRGMDTIFLNKISKLASIYIMFVERGAGDRPINRIATSLVDESHRPVRGDVVITRTGHIGIGAKIFALENPEIDTLLERVSKIYGTPVKVVAR